MLREAVDQLVGFGLTANVKSEWEHRQSVGQSGEINHHDGFEVVKVYSMGIYPEVE
ncbi:hypothetical protein CERSUDRAFT_112777 [Gelatoporia subvermispora B]|uniref:Uncharacterized protein n=1 Tax=Ceriporiopsis subvermispora (strain B) TaxID=914234 RepID=M2RKT5_CERS8|nr:hypothetical protein CERSUDRAFT_112777 [Gelatoporia subvermispora B]